jgi:DNA (cytosine-5)-methyltransferase 1
MRPRAVELFGGEGISALGYALAGFDVTLVENDPVRIANAVQHPNVTVVEADATTYPLDGFDVVTGGPPCTGHSETAGLANEIRGSDAGTEWMLQHTLQRVREWAAATGGLWVIENVEGARKHFTNPVQLCGTQFGIEDEGWHLQRHRLFESNAALMAPGPCRHAGKRFIQVHGDLSVNDRACGGRRRPGGDMRAGVERAKRLMGAPWASARGLALGVPVAYTRHLGEQLIPAVRGCLAGGAR